MTCIHIFIHIYIYINHFINNTFCIYLYLYIYIYILYLDSPDWCLEVFSCCVSFAENSGSLNLREPLIKKAWKHSWNPSTSMRPTLGEPGNMSDSMHGSVHAKQTRTRVIKQGIQRWDMIWLLHMLCSLTPRWPSVLRATFIDLIPISPIILNTNTHFGKCLLLSAPTRDPSPPYLILWLSEFVFQFQQQHSKSVVSSLLTGRRHIFAGRSQTC